MTAPPDIAIIIRPDISLVRVGYFSTVIENTSGKIFATASPIRKTSAQAIKGDDISSIATRHIIPRIEVHIKNFREDIFVSIIAPAKVPSIRPKKYTLLPDSAVVESI
jgi:hypothetical protein